MDKTKINVRKGHGQPEGKQRRWERKGEQVGGGFWIMRRGDRTDRIRPSTFAFEHPSYDSAKLELDRLAEAHPEGKFIIVSQWAAA